MTDQTPNIPPQDAHDDEPFIPPSYMLGLAFIGLLVAIVVRFTQPTFNVIGWGGLGIMVLSLLGWAVLAPQQARAFFTGRTARFGGTSLLVTFLFLVALIALYTVIRGQAIRIDLTERDSFSLTAESREAVSAIGADPNIRPVRIVAFYGPAQAGRRDQDSLLFEDYRRTSGDKISYEFVDPDRSPALAQQFGVTRPGQIAIAPVAEDGSLLTDDVEIVNFFAQDQLTNALLRLASNGDFRAYFLNVTDGLDLTSTGPAGMSNLRDILTQQFDWTARAVSFFELTAPDSAITLNDAAADGEVLIIAGGSEPLAQEELDFLTSYLDAGGNLVLLAGVSIDPERPALAVAENLSTYLFENFGLRLQDDIVLDRVQAFQSPENPVALNFNRGQYIASNLPNNAALVFRFAHPIEVAETPPAGVTVTPFAFSGADAYSKPSATVFSQDAVLDRLEEDTAGPFTLAAVAENANTGSRLVVFGSTFIATNNAAQLNQVANLDAIFNSLVWTTDFENFFRTVNIQSAQRPQDAPIFVSQQNAGLINLIAIFLLPFGILGIGLLVWWNNREPAR